MKIETGRWRGFAALTLLLGFLQASYTAADTHYWNHASGEWGVLTNWSPWFMPGTGDYGYIHYSSSITVTRPASTPSYSYPGPYWIELDGRSGATVTVEQTANNMYASYEAIGTSGRARFVHHSGLNYLDQALLLAHGANAIGTYSIDSITASITSPVLDIATAAGAVGVFDHSDGTVSIGSTFRLASVAGATATYANTGGTLQAPDVQLGAGGVATFTQNAGASQVTGQFYVGSAIGGVGTLEVLNGTLTVNGVTHVGRGFGTLAGASGTLEVWGAGRLNAQNGVVVTSTPSSTGRALLHGGTLASGGNVFLDGGRLELVGGTIQLSSGRTIRLEANAYLSATASPFRVGGNTGVIVNAGSLSAAGVLGVGSASVGSLLLDGATSRLLAGSSLVGTAAGGVGTVTIRNGASATFGNLQVGVNGATGLVTVSGSSSFRTNSDLTLGDVGGVGSFTQSGGTSTIAQRLFMGSGSLGSGGASTEVGRLNISGGTCSVGTAAYVGGFTAADGAATIGVAGTGAFITPSLQVFGPGRVVQSAGTLSADILWLRGGQYTQTGGNTLSKRIEFTGGTLSQSGGTTTCDRIWIGSASLTTGTYLLSGNGVLNVQVNGIGVGGDTTAAYGTGVLSIKRGNGKRVRRRQGPPRQRSELHRWIAHCRITRHQHRRSGVVRRGWRKSAAQPAADDSRHRPIGSVRQRSGR